MNRACITICAALIACAASAAVAQQPVATLQAHWAPRVAENPTQPDLPPPDFESDDPSTATENKLAPAPVPETDLTSGDTEPLVNDPETGPPRLLRKESTYNLWRPAFDSQAELQPIGGDGGETPADCSPLLVEKSDRRCRYVVFAQPASFALPQFDKDGGRSPRKAVVIYEGMAIRVSDDGRYVMRMVVETPATDVDLRLQFHVVAPGGSVVLGHSVMGGRGFGDCSADAQSLFGVGADGRGNFQEFGTISLPVIRFRPSREQKKSTDALYWQVEQKGYSPLLNDGTLKPHSPQGDRRDALRLIRTGVMQMGSAPESAEY
jgi:hypothetical protein